ncbi:MAG: DUF4258 domain-containing protein [Dehalococcoidia bacterium]
MTRHPRQEGEQFSKFVVFSQHALDQMPERGVTREEVELAITSGERALAKKGRMAFRKNLPFQAWWKGRYYEGKQILAIVTEEPNRWVVITVYVFYFGGHS